MELLWFAVEWAWFNTWITETRALQNNWTESQLLGEEVCSPSFASAPSLDWKPFYVFLFKIDEYHNAYTFLSLETRDMILEINLPIVTFAVCWRNEHCNWGISPFLGSRSAGGSARVCVVKCTKFRVWWISDGFVDYSLSSFVDVGLPTGHLSVPEGLRLWVYILSLWVSSSSEGQSTQAYRARGQLIGGW